MPAGNDAKTAATELADEFGKGVGNADELIRTSRSRYDGLLGAAQLKSEEGEELNLADVAKAAGVKSVVSATKRGDAIVYVHEDGEGRLVKGAISAAPTKAPAPAPKKSKKDDKGAA